MFCYPYFAKTGRRRRRKRILQEPGVKIYARLLIFAHGGFFNRRHPGYDF